MELFFRDYLLNKVRMKIFLAMFQTLHYSCQFDLLIYASSTYSTYRRHVIIKPADDVIIPAQPPWVAVETASCTCAERPTAQNQHKLPGSPAANTAGSSGGVGRLIQW